MCCRADTVRQKGTLTRRGPGKFGCRCLNFAHRQAARLDHCNALAKRGFPDLAELMVPASSDMENLLCTFCRTFWGKWKGNRSTALAFCATRCMLLQCGSGRVPLTLPSPSLGVSSLDLGRLHRERPFFFFSFFYFFVAQVSLRDAKFILQQPDKVATLPAGSPPDGRPGIRTGSRAWRTTTCAGSAAHPYTAPG